MDLGILSLLPPVLAIALAIATRQVYLSLFLGIWAGKSLLEKGVFSGLSEALMACVKVFESGYNTQVILFCALIGALISLVQKSGGVKGFILWITQKKWVTNRRRANLLAFISGSVIFIESSITCLVTGAISRPLFDQYKISREKLAYLIDCTSACICIMIPMNAWGAYVIGLLEKEAVSSPLQVFLYSIPLNFYALTTLAFTLFIVLSQKDFGPMKKAEQRAKETGEVIRPGSIPMISDEITEMEPSKETQPRALLLILPILTLIFMMPWGLWVTGNGDILEGSGATSVFWAVLASILVACVLSVWKKALKTSEISPLIFKGIGGLVPLATLMILAFAIGDVSRELETGTYVASLIDPDFPKFMIPALIFLTGSFIAFSTGTSWGVFAIMIPIAIPVAETLGIPLPLVLASVLSGGIFGDHCSPISDTTLVSSMSAACDHIDHVRTQLPYALFTGSLSFLAFIFAASIF